jgi:DNA polymerase-3 subunit alpha
MVEHSGLVKADILRVTTIESIAQCVDLVKKNCGLDYLAEDASGVQLLYNLPDDDGVYADFYNKKTDSSFQFNTHLIKGYIQQFMPTSREHLSALTALCRPGALDGLMELNAVVEVEYDDGTIEYKPVEEYDLWLEKLKK